MYIKMEKKRKGFFLVLDGIDGCGKSTQSKLIYKYFHDHNYKVLLTAEPTDGEIGKILRKCLKNDDVIIRSRPSGPL